MTERKGDGPRYIVKKGTVRDLIKEIEGVRPEDFFKALYGYDADGVVVLPTQLEMTRAEQVLPVWVVLSQAGFGYVTTCLLGDGIDSRRCGLPNTGIQLKLFDRSDGCSRVIPIPASEEVRWARANMGLSVWPEVGFEKPGPRIKRNRRSGAAPARLISPG